jgi:magnesium transporter
MAEIGRRFKLHPLVLEDILNTDQRPKVDDYGDYLFMVARFFEIDGETGQIGSDQVSLILRSKLRAELSGTAQRPLRSPARAPAPGSRPDPQAGRRLPRLFPARHGGRPLFHDPRTIGERTEELEDMMLERPRPGALQTVHQLKRETLTLRRSIWPLREVINNLTRADERFFRPETRPYLRDVYDHTVHAIESLEANRDVIAGLLDVYLSSASNRVNQEVRALTVVAIIFMPATLISGIFGMNFKPCRCWTWPNGFTSSPSA